MLPVLAIVAALGLVGDDLKLERRIDELLKANPLIDGHNDLAWAIREHGQGLAVYDLGGAAPGHTDIARLRKGRVGAQLWSVYVPADKVPGGHIQVQLEQIDLARAFIARYPHDLELALTADELERSFKNGRIGSLLALEGGHVIVDSLAVLRSYYTLGARAMTLTHTVQHPLGRRRRPARQARRPVRLRRGGRPRDEPPRHARRPLARRRRHHGRRPPRQSAAPVVFTHSSARALTDVPRNVPDDVLRRIPANGGLVMVTFVPSFVARAQRPRATLADVADHIEHIRDLAGVDHVGLGSDFDGMTAVPQGLGDVSTFPALLAELARRGWSDEHLARLAGGNLLRVLRRVEATARALQASRGASTRKITDKPR
jgi:membrane dipeptidase